MSDTPQNPASDDLELRERPVSIVTFKHHETGEEIGPIYLPYEGEPPSEEEAYAQAWEYYRRVEHIRERLSEEEIETLATDLRTGEYGKWLTRELRAVMATVTVAAKPGDDDTPEEIAESEAAAAEMNALLRDKGDTLADALLEASPRWQEFARDALSQAWAQALGDLLARHPDALEWPDDRFHPALIAQYNEGGYLYGATRDGASFWSETIARDIAALLESGDGKMGPLAEMIEEKARDRVRARMPRPETPFERDIFGEDGYALIPSDVVSNSTRRALLDGPRFWAQLPDTGRPEGRHDIGPKKAPHAQGRIFFGISDAAYPTPEDAFSIVRGLGLAHWDVFSYVMARWLEEGERGPYGGVYVSAERFLDSRAAARMKSGIHRPEYVEAFYRNLYHLEAITVAGDVPHHKKGRPAVIVDTDLLNITQRVRQKQLDGSEKLLGCYVRPGDWSADLQDMAPQVALTLRSIFQLDNKRQRHTKLIALYLVEYFKNAASSKGTARTLYIKTILEGACIEISTSDRKNPSRFRRLIEDAIEDLIELEPALLTRWRYLDTVPMKGRGMLDQWLAARVALTPAPAFQEQYRPIAETRSARIARRKPAALKG